MQVMSRSSEVGFLPGRAISAFLVGCGGDNSLPILFPLDAFGVSLLASTAPRKAPRLLDSSQHKFLVTPVVGLTCASLYLFVRSLYSHGGGSEPSLGLLDSVFSLQLDLTKMT